VLGCSGGVGVPGARTTGFLVDEHTLIDAGTGIVDLTLDELAKIDRVFVTHSHLDHVLGIPLLLDAVSSRRERPLVVHALSATIDSLRRHLFNWTMWPDFTVIPAADRPGLVFETIEVNEQVCLPGGACIRALPAAHVVPALGYEVRGETASLVFTGDTGRNPGLWPLLESVTDLRHLVIECAFAEIDRTLAEVSCHLCPSLLAAELARLPAEPRIHVTHLKPGDSELTMRDIARLLPARNVERLREGEVFLL
jgi:ribonuclease BN (tRNA processing enzyme)